MGVGRGKPSKCSDLALIAVTSSPPPVPFPLLQVGLGQTQPAPASDGVRPPEGLEGLGAKQHLLRMGQMSGRSQSLPQLPAILEALEEEEEEKEDLEVGLEEEEEDLEVGLATRGMVETMEIGRAHV